jgi:hypothetical protein
VISLQLASRTEVAWAQRQVAEHHYLHAPVDPRSRPMVYVVRLVAPKVDRPVGCLIFGRPEAQRCFDGKLTYGSLADIQAGRAQFDRWEVLNLARVWFDPCVQQPGYLYHNPAYLPGFYDRHYIFRPTLASTVIRQALARVGYDYLTRHSPVDCAYPYQIKAVLSYCDRSRHKGTIYRAADFQLARTNERQIETWYTATVAPLSAEQDADIRRLTETSRRSQRIRGRRAQMELGL